MDLIKGNFPVPDDFKLNEFLSALLTFAFLPVTFSRAFFILQSFDYLIN